MTFVQSGMPPRLPAHDQCMLSHDISACSATWSLTAQSGDQRLSVTWSPYDKHVISERPATWSLHAQSGGQFLISHLISACTVPWSAPVSHWSLPDKHVISARTATSSVHAQSRDQCMIATWSVHDQLREQSMISHVISAWSDKWSVYDQPREKRMLSHVIRACWAGWLLSAHLLDNCQLSCTIPACHLLDNCQLCCVIPACSAGNNQAAEQALITWLSMHCSRGWSYTDHMIDHALITWISCTNHVTDHALITWLSCTDHVADHALVMWLIMHWSRAWSYTDQIKQFIAKKKSTSKTRRIVRFSSVQFSHSVMSDSLWPRGLQHARPPCPSPTPGVHSNSCPLSWRTVQWVAMNPFNICHHNPEFFHYVELLCSPRKCW